MFLRMDLLLLASIAATSAVSIPRHVSGEVNHHISIDLSGRQILKYILPLRCYQKYL
jgi:hypothetical protein